jgi:threonylcarbamoyladenosine tRNA methylthiotransferase MtaB
MTTLDVVSFGCRLNVYESEIVRARASEAGLDDAVVFNTCAVTGEAVRQARQAIRRARRDRPRSKILVTGCAAQTAAQEFAAMPEVDRVLGNGEKLEARNYRFAGDGTDARVRVGEAAALRRRDAPPVSRFHAHSRAFLEVQNGCDHRCTFCIIPHARGPSRSVPAARLVAEVRRLLESGHKEVVLTGVDVTDYGRDLADGSTLGRLVRRILAEVSDLPRLRLTSIDTVEADPDLFRALAEEERLMPHLHLSLQSGDDMILKRMKRRHGRADAIALCERLRRERPGIVFGADVIVGFPTETDAMFERSVDLVAECGLTYLHVFPFSPRPGTPAARMPAVPSAVVAARAEALRARGRAVLARFLAGETGRVRRVLVEAGNRGHTEHNAQVRFLADAARGSLVDAAIIASRGDHLVASPAP